MDGYKAYKYYTALKLHFTSQKYNVFKNRGAVRSSVDKFNQRNDRALFEKVARHFPTDRECIMFFAANFMYGNPQSVWQFDDALANYSEYQRRRQSITRVFTNDLDTLLKSHAQYTFSGLSLPDVLQFYLASKITLETVVILNDMDGFIDQMKDSTVAVLLGDELLKIEKSKGFVKYDSYKVMSPYQQFLEETKGNCHGQDLPQPNVG